MPDPNQHQCQPQQSGWTAARRAQAQAEARSGFERDRQAAQATEAQRRHPSAAYQAQYQQWAESRSNEIRQHNAGIAERATGLRNGDPERSPDLVHGLTKEL
ncbi:hypothetical protein [Streptomyces hirsutus]|uniref:hypothetical protein n=1 Tax=Streptomyces hirsutus TaxID=35620 RepID=UPI00389A3C12